MSSAPHVQIHVFNYVFSAETVLIWRPVGLESGQGHELALFRRSVQVGDLIIQLKCVDRSQHAMALTVGSRLCHYDVAALIGEGGMDI